MFQEEGANASALVGIRYCKGDFGTLGNGGRIPEGNVPADGNEVFFPLLP
jgi:hypothetical protein